MTIETAISFWSDIKRYEDMLDADPRSYCFAPLSELYRKLGLLDDAISVARKGCALHPEYAGGYLALASALIDKGEKGEAREALERVVAANADNIKAQKLLSQIYAEAGETALAAKALRRVLADNPNDAESALLLRTLADTGDQEPPAEGAPEGVEDLEEIEELEELELVELELELVEELPEELSEPEEVTADDAFDMAALFEAEEAATREQVKPAEAEPEALFALEEVGSEVRIAPELSEQDDLFEADDRFEAEDLFAEDLTAEDLAAEDLAAEVAHPDEEPVAPASTAAGRKDPLSTATMAELYLSQGFPEKSLRIYRALLEDEPANLTYTRRAGELERMIAAGGEASAAGEIATAETAETMPAAPAAGAAPGAADSEPGAVEILEKWLENIQRRKQHAL